MLLITLKLFSSLFIVATLIPFLKWDFWWIRVFDYPRLQELVLIFVLIVIWLISPISAGLLEYWIFIVALTACFIFLLFKVIPFSPFGKKMIETVEFDENSSIHILVANVYQENSNYEKVLFLVNERKPNLIFLVETDSKWEKGLESLDQKFTYQLKLPMDNTYGILLYSNLEITSHQINHLIDEEIPSIDLDVKLLNGEIIKIYGIHPTPPVPTQNPKSTDRDAEILLVGKKVKSDGSPSLVIGDLNDVAWSYTTELFLKISEMVDPRRGRGLFNTFNAKILFLRWPLDHFFLSHHFGLVQLRTEKSIGSDHFPISIIARLTKENDTETKKANLAEKKEARDKIDRGLNDKN
jgi:endonuclease/exonuclease/phosphatase (EEP) superfamily protein YafD